MPENYDAPTMVAFYEIYNKEDVLYGIAFEGKIICACCGSIFLGDEVYITEEYPWTNFREIFEKKRRKKHLTPTVICGII